MIPIRDSTYSKETPYVTWTIVGLNALIYLWDRGGSIFGPSQAFVDLAMHPRDVVQAILGRGDAAELGKLFTAMFLHGSFIHLIGNLLYLAAFGPNVEAALGSARYALFYLFWGVCAFGAQIFVFPHSETSVLGASGAIGGVLGAYFLLFPANKIKILVPPFVWWTFEISAFILLGVWFLGQILFPQDGVATWAHGGAKKLVANNNFVKDEEFDTV